jgi:hypothetical protein
MANPFITNASPMGQITVDPEAQVLQRQKQYAAMLMQQNQQPQGQMVSGNFVAPSWTQQLNAALSPVLGAYMMNKSDTEQEKLAQKLRKESAQEMMEYNKLRYGSQGTPEVIPQGQTLRDDQGQLTYGAQQGIAPVVANPQAAFNYAMEAKSPVVSGMALEMLKPQKLAEGEKIVTFNPVEGKEQVVMQGGEKYHAPISVDAGNMVQLRDPKDPTKVIATIAKSKLGGNTLPEGATKQVTGSVNMVDAINNYQTKLNKYNGLALTPSARADLGNSYNNMMLQAKEAYNLGVLNGPDYDILRSVVQDPNSFKGAVVDTKALIAQSNALGKTAENTINNAYGVHNVEVPDYVKSKINQLPHYKDVNEPPPAANLKNKTQNQPSGKVERPPMIDEMTWKYMNDDQKALFGKRR